MSDMAAVNKGPTGGSYRNSNNVLSDSGMTHPTEATSNTGDQMAAMPSQDNRGSIGGSSSPASAKDMAGGN